MTRIFLDQPLGLDQTLTLPEAASRHLVQVLRLREGDAFIAFNGQGGEYGAVIHRIAKRDVQVRIGSFNAINRESPLSLTLAQCVSKGDRMDYTLQKAVELGVSEIVPLLSERSVVKLDAERWEKKMEHWRGVVISACEQSGRTRIPALHTPAPINAWLTQDTGTTLKLTLAPEASRSFHSIELAQRPVILLVGPEGGLSDAEIQRAESKGFEAITLGPRILRTETAGVAALAAIQALWGDWH